MSAPDKIHELVERFGRNLRDYHAADYKEAEVRLHFIDPFFEVLGWDVYNRKGYAGRWREVVPEASIKGTKGTKAPDYAFRLGGRPLFFVEAKKPSIDIADEPAPAYQLRRYAWTVKLPLSVLTDFEEFAIYDCRVKPAASDRSTVARLKLIKYTEYTTRWDEIAGLFSPDAIQQGGFERFIDSSSNGRGTEDVDTAFLAEMEGWRELLARNLAIRNPDLSVRELNTAVQRTLDRILFLRISEDRDIEPYGQLQQLARTPGVYSRLLELLLRADDRYNSGLFHFRREQGRSGEHDTLTPSLTIDDRVLKSIIDDLYFPRSPYALSVLPADILGQIYERFLGRVIRLTPKHRAKVEEKPEVRKAGGVYYTPTDIVDYIIDQSLGKLISDRSPDEVASIRVLDPACGSGSFLIGALQYLLDWHLEYYVTNNPERHARRRPARVRKDHAGEWHLTTEEKKRIVLNNIYGVDIDPQAVEVTKLSLFLKVLEGESTESLATQLSMWQDRVLPNLVDNIKCGNSVVETDVLGLLPLDEITNELVLSVNPFDWAKEFPTVFTSQAGGGFDVVIGNPPYVLLQALNTPTIEGYLRDRYASARYKVDMYLVFFEKFCELARSGGVVGLITPNTFLRNKYAVSLREYLLSHTEILSLRLFEYSVFAGASVDTAVTIARKSRQPDPGSMVHVSRSVSQGSAKDLGTITQSAWANRRNREFDLPGSELAESLIDKMHDSSVRLGTFATAYFGLQTHGRRKYVETEPKGPMWKPALDGGNINRYDLAPPTEYVCTESSAIKSGGNPEVHGRKRIGIRQIGKRPIATILPSGWYSLNTIYNVYFTVDTEYKLEYVLGLLQSNLIGWYWEKRHFDHKRTFPKIKKAPLLSLPIASIDFSNDERQQHDTLVELVRMMLGLHEQLRTARTDFEREALRRQIDATDTRIDNLVNELYKLTAKEVALVNDLRES